MKERSLDITFNQGGLGGPLVEKVFFGSSRQELENIWGLRHLEDLKDAESLHMRPELFSLVKACYFQSAQDGKERGALVSWQNDGLEATGVVGKTSVYDYGKKGVVNTLAVSLNYENTFQFNWRRLFGKPHAIAFHTHPSIFVDRLESVAVVLPTGETERVTAETFVKFHDFVANSFSSDDLGVFFQSKRYLASMLLATKQRLLYIAPTSLRLQPGLARFNRSHLIYERQKTLIETAAWLRLFELMQPMVETSGLLADRSARETFTRALKLNKEAHSLAELETWRDACLSRICANEGMVCFASQALDEPLLKRIEVRE